MALLGTFTKQPGETLDCDISYATVLAGRTDVIANKATAVSPGGGLTVSTSTIINAGLGIKLVVTGGLDGQTYRITVTATSDATPPLIYEDEIDVVVDEV